jgi:hypothetical protein
MARTGTMRDTALALQEALGDPDADGERVRDLADALAGGTLEVSHMLSDPSWAPAMLDDIAGIVGADPNPDGEQHWQRH